MAQAESELAFPPPIPRPREEMPTQLADGRSTLAEVTQTAPRDEEAELAFIATRAHAIRTHPYFDRAQRAIAFAELVERVGHEIVTAAENPKTPPVPGGVGGGFFYSAAFKSAFAQGTSSYFEIVCPNLPAGNVDTWLYLTGMNRAGRGIEAFVSYHSQDEPRFKVFDWARPEAEHWQTDAPFGSLGSYLGTTSAHGQSYQVLGVWNSTYQISSKGWRNEVLLWNRAANRWDLVYRYDYTGNQAMLIGRNESGAWGTWQLLSSANSWVRNDNLGFFDVFLDPNYSVVVDS